MNPSILAKLTTCHNSRDIDAITWEEVCWAKAHMNRDVSMYADAKYQQTDEEKSCAVQQVVRLLKQKVITPRSGHGTGIAYDYELTVENAHKLCDIAAMEDLYSRICPTCHGKGDAVIRYKHVVCETCEGTGRLQFTPDRIAWMLKVSKRTYWRRYAEPYNKIAQILGYWDSQVYRAVNLLRDRNGTEILAN